MRICIINEFFYPDETGGTGAVLSTLAQGLRREYTEVEIDVVTSRHLYRGVAGHLPAQEEWEGIHITRLATPRPHGLPAPLRLAANALFAAASLGAILARRRYDLLVVGTAPPTVVWAAQAYRRLTGTPYLYIVYDLEPDRAGALGLLAPQSPLAFLLKRGQRGWLHSAATAVVLGRCMREHVCAAYGLSPERVAVVPIGADPEEIVPQDHRTRFRTAHGLTGFLVCYSGNFGRYHNFDTVLNAAKKLAERGQEVTFLLVGDGAQREHIARRIAEENLQNVRLFPFVPKAEYPDLLASADASLVTLEPGMEGLCVPSKFYSILASGRPVLALVAPRSEVARVVAEAACGFQVAHGDSGALADAVTFLAAHPEEAVRLGQNARQALTERFAAAHIARQYHDLMQAAARSTWIRPGRGGTTSAELAAGLLQDGITVRLSGSGGSMRPWLRPGTAVTVAPLAAPVALRVGDIAFVRCGGRLMLHRVVQTRPQVRTKGDALGYLDPIPDLVLGRAHGFGGPRDRCIARLSLVLLPVQRGLLLLARLLVALWERPKTEPS